LKLFLTFFSAFFLRSNFSVTMCRICTIKPANNGFSKCQTCFERGRTCRVCNSRPVNPGFSLCDQCFRIKKSSTYLVPNHSPH
jgi:hypothetical protein